MSEDSLPTSTLQAEDVPAALSAGALLRQAREAAGLHVAALAVSMKVPVKKLEALEADRLDLLPDAVFVRALASSVCRTLKMDPTPVLQKLPQTTVPRLDAEERGINAPFQASNQSTQASLKSLITKPVSLGVVGLLLAAGAVAILPRIPGLEKDAEVVVSPSAPVGSTVEASPTEVINNPAPLASSPVDTATPQVAAPSVQATSSPALATVKPQLVESPASPPAVVAKTAVSAPVGGALPTFRPGTAASGTHIATQPSTAAPSPMQATVDLAHATSGIIVFKASGTSWVEVTDAKGIVQLRKTLVAGESAAASGAVPLAVVIGRTDVTQVDVRGRPFSLLGIAKDNVARFEVK